jgi:hypothetical protein
MLPCCLALLAALTWGPAVGAATGCAATLAELRILLGEASFPLSWEETSMDDGMPLRVSILEKDGAIFLEFIKTGQGLWAQSAGELCRSGAQLEIRFRADQIHTGPAANWVLRLARGQGGAFTLTRLASDRMRIATSGWSGIFSPKPK